MSVCIEEENTMAETSLLQTVHLVTERIENSFNLLPCIIATFMIQRLRPAPSVFRIIRGLTVSNCIVFVLA